MQKIIRILVCNLVLMGCQPQPTLHDFYVPKQQRLAQILDYCKVNGMKYALTNPMCRKAAKKGIYWNLPKYYKHCCCCVEKPSRWNP